MMGAFQGGERVHIMLKMTIMALMPVAWAIILYPAAKILKRSWIALAATAGVFSVLSLAAKRLIDRIHPLSVETTLYIVSILFGLAVLSFIFNTKNSWLYEKKAVARDKGPLHLRHVLSAAVMLEKDSIKFYEALERKAADPALKALCSQLVAEERSHKETMEERVSRWLPLKMRGMPADAVYQDLKKTTGMFLDPPPPSANADAMVRYAIDQELRAARFYLSFEKEFPRAWKRAHIQMIVIWERAHAAKLEGFLSHAA